jgi:Flp pilus assembly protein TadD
VTAALNLLGTLHSQLQDPEGAERQFRKALKLRDGEEDDEAIGAVLFNLVLIRWQQGDLAEAEQLLLKSLAIRRRLGGEDHPAVVLTRDTFARLLRKIRRK